MKQSWGTLLELLGLSRWGQQHPWRSDKQTGRHQEPGPAGEQAPVLAEVMDTLPSVLLSLQALATTLNWGDADHSQALKEEKVS